MKKFLVAHYLIEAEGGYRINRWPTLEEAESIDELVARRFYDASYIIWEVSKEYYVKITEEKKINASIVETKHE